MFYELEVCGTVLDQSFAGKGKSPELFHVEFRLLDTPTSSALVLAGPVRSTRQGAELDMEMVPFKPTKREKVTKDGISVERCIPEELPGIVGG